MLGHVSITMTVITEHSHQIEHRISASNTLTHATDIFVDSMPTSLLFRVIKEMELDKSHAKETGH